MAPAYGLKRNRQFKWLRQLLVLKIDNRDLGSLTERRDSRFRGFRHGDQGAEARLPIVIDERLKPRNCFLGVQRLERINHQHAV